MILILGALLGFVAVAFGAYAEHGLRNIVTDEHFRYLMTALRYNQVHAVVITALGLVFANGGKLSNIPTLKLSALLFIIGTVIFSFSIYLSVTFDLPALLNITPLGGMTIMGAWFLLVVAGNLARKKL